SRDGQEDADLEWCGAFRNRFAQKVGAFHSDRDAADNLVFQRVKFAPHSIAEFDLQVQGRTIQSVKRQVFQFTRLADQLSGHVSPALGRSLIAQVFAQVGCV